MSYILDAIKKADQKRKLGEVPDVDTIHDPPMAEPRRFGWLYGFAVILFINAAGLAWWLWGETPGPEPVVHVPANSTMVTGQQMPTLSTFQKSDLQATPAMPVASAPPASPQSIEPASSFRSRGDTPPVDPQVNSGNTQTVELTPLAQPPQAVVKEEESAPSANPTAFVPVQEEIPPLPPSVDSEVTGEDFAVSDEEPLMEAEEDLSAEEEVVGQVAGDQVLVPIATSSEPKEKTKKARRDEEDPELAKIPFLKQLPVEMQKTLPVLHISFHSYSIKPSERLVSISGKILRQGQEIDEDLKLEKITFYGVVLSFKGKLFRLDV